MTDYIVKSIKSELCKEWLLNKHYAKRLCSISFSFGLFNKENILMGVITFGMPPSSTLSSSICGEKYKINVLELNRLVVNDGLPKNTLSFFVSNSIKKIPDNKIIVSFADANMNHNGYIYQATNFIYTGYSSNTSKLIDKDGKEFHFRNIGHYQKNNRLNVNLVKRRLNENLIDKKEIAKYLRSNKKNYKNKDLEKNLNIPKTTIEHWFRLDNGFSFPTIEHWIKLKQFLKFDDTYDIKMLAFEMIPDTKEIIKKLMLKSVEILPKHRYVYFKGDKKFKRECKKYFKLEVLDYPKGANKRYDTSYKPTIQTEIF
jgi:uncharacterized membrane protein